MKEFGDRLREERDKRGWTQVYVANRLGYSKSQTYANWEYGSREPDLETLCKIADVFDLPVDYLLGRKLTEDEAKIAKQHRLEKLIHDIENDVYLGNDGKKIPPDDKATIINVIRLTQK